MKKIYLILICNVFFLTINSAQEGWTKQTASFTSGLRGVYAIDSLNIWAVGLDGLIIHTTDGGTTWNSIPTEIEKGLYTVEFINPDTGWVAGAWDSKLSNIYRTTDGGINWVEQSLPGGSQNHIMDVDFIAGPAGEPMRGYCVGGLAHVWKTSNYGETWEKAGGDCGEGNFNSCFFVDSLTGWFVGTPSSVKPYTIMHTNDGTDSFVEQTDQNEIKLNGVCFGTNLKGIAVGNNGVFIYTNDGGESWKNSTTSVRGSWNSVYLTKTGNAWAVESSGTIAYSDDWGNTWKTQESGSNDLLWEVYFINDKEGWAVGGLSGSVVLHTKNAGKNTTSIQDKTSAKSISVYPNPVYDILRIESDFPLIKVEIFSIGGMKVKEFYTDFNAIQTQYLPRGIYILKIHSEKGVTAKKLTKE